KKLDDNNRRLLNAIIRIAKSAQKERDKLAHWVWGTSSSLPDALLLSDPRNLNFEADMIYVYTAEDFENIRVKCERIAGFAMRFRFILKGHVANTNNRLYDTLCEEPEISEILNRRT